MWKTSSLQCHLQDALTFLHYSVCKEMQSLELRVIPEADEDDIFVDGSFKFPSFTVARDKYGVDTYLRSQLRTMRLEHVTFPQTSFAPGINIFSESCFPNLTELSLTMCEGVKNLEVTCPNLMDLDITCIEMIELVLKTPRIMTLRVDFCFTEEDEEGTLVDIWAPRLQLFQWTCNVIPCKFYMRTPTYVNNIEVLLLPFDVNGERIRSAANILSLLCMGKKCCMEVVLLTLFMFLVLFRTFAKLGVCGVQTGMCTNLLEVKLETSMTKKEILGISFLLRVCQLLHILKVNIIERSWNVNTDNWEWDLLDNRNIKVGEFWESLPQYQRSILQHLEVVEITMLRDVEGRDISFMKFLIQHCKGLKELTVIFDSAMADKAAMDSFLSQIGEAKKASPDVEISVGTRLYD